MREMAKMLLQLENVSKRYLRHTVVQDISFSIFEGQSLAILGKNGSGKSTILKIILGLSKATNGLVRQLRGDKLKIGYIPEQFPKNLRFTPDEYLYHLGKIQGLSSYYLQKRIPQLISQFQLDAVKNLWIHHLSKGMRQKVGIMQAILHEPDILVLDEPLSGLDMTTQQHLIEQILSLKKSGVAIIFTCHEMDLLRKVADRAIILEDKKIKEDFMLQEEIDDYMIIECRWHDSKACDLLRDVDGVTEYISLTEDVWRIQVVPSYSDRLIAQLLCWGASICSVTKHEDDHYEHKINEIFQT